jgi:general L-amino acid transport system substrate-binding protein
VRRDPFFARFSAENNQGKREGFDIDLCKAIAAAALGDETKIQLTPMDLKTAFAGLPTGVVDVLTHRFTWTESRDVGGLKFPKIMFFDGQGFVVSKKTKAGKIADLNNATICTLQGSTSELIVASYFGAHKMKYKIVTFASAEQAWDAFVGKRCDTVINDRSVVGAERVLFGTDWPHQVHDTKGAFANTAALPESEMKAVRSGNAERVFEL